MLAKRTAYKEVLDDIFSPYESFRSKLDSNNNETLKLNLSKSLTFRFPAFVCEVKSDGERMLAHINRGIVKFQVSYYQKNIDFIIDYFYSFNNYISRGNVPGIGKYNLFSRLNIIDILCC